MQELSTGKFHGAICKQLRTPDVLLAILKQEYADRQSAKRGLDVDSWPKRNVAFDSVRHVGDLDDPMTPFELALGPYAQRATMGYEDM